jgi:hypothetical protein
VAEYGLFKIVFSEVERGHERSPALKMKKIE